MAGFHYGPVPGSSTIASAHPFVHQIDVVLSRDSDAKVVEELQSMSCAFVQVSQLPLANIFDDASFATRRVITVGLFHSEDLWYIDVHGFLNIWANKDTYERLSLVGVPVDKKRRDRFTVRVDLKDRTRKGFQRAKDACMRWDAQRQESGLLSWDVLMPIEKGAIHIPSGVTQKLHHVPAYVSHQKDLTIPHIGLGPRPVANDDGASAWDERMHELFEWIGMVCINSPRVLASNRVDSYISRYSPPDGSLGEVVHVRWCGLLSTSLIQDVISLLRGSAFACVVIHGWEAAGVAVLGGSWAMVQAGGRCVSTSSLPSPSSSSSPL